MRREYSTTTPTVTNLTVSVPFPGSAVTGGAATAISGAGWALGPVTGPAATSWTYSFVWFGELTNTSQSTAELRFVVPALRRRRRAAR